MRVSAGETRLRDSNLRLWIWPRAPVFCCHAPRAASYASRHRIWFVTFGRPFMHNHCLCDQLRIRIPVSLHGRAARTTPKRTSLNSQRHVSLVFFVFICFIMVNVNAIGGTSRPLASPADESKKMKRVQGWLCKFKYISQWHCFLRKPRACRTRFAVLFLAYKTLSIDRNHLEQTKNIYIYSSRLTPRSAESAIGDPRSSEGSLYYHTWLF